MAKLIMNLRGVPDDEADEVRELLNQYNIDFYETPPNRWGITSGGIWLKDADCYPQAKRLLDEYQRKRSERVRAEYEAMRQRGEIDTLLQRVAREPLKAALYTVLMLIILAFMTIPFVYLALGVTKL
ncbi:DUF6164 family protein [Halorhodospira halochloris]|uniref:Transmembrane protein n=1 Tax=Halorhodospira halochloris TaxID=1052 RepID=A0A120MZZ1_HALHR|nr:DUF6164 family protein [Halorhodospira halochloris]MBK1651936.1 hypothetical protein [Halorhodospira halochloris]MCG5530363.1 DUF6164 family protein [Halorhodospira halochloris]MCG5547955.1 DUF6164 family protein [Halorhodospira halochloris]BAU58227.1 hypothetical protein HH1059_15210 [Halorhodospira halochloris]